MQLKDKIEALIVGLGLTSTRFADYIGINRPIISHILSGRNKPSLEIVQRIVSKFPELGFNWIADDVDLDMDIVAQLANKQDFSGLFNSQTKAQGLNNPQQLRNPLEILNSDGSGLSENKKIERIVVFYSDSSFQQFSPG